VDLKSYCDEVYLIFCATRLNCIRSLCAFSWIILWAKSPPRQRPALTLKSALEISCLVMTTWKYASPGRTLLWELISTPIHLGIVYTSGLLKVDQRDKNAIRWFTAETKGGERHFERIVLRGFRYSGRNPACLHNICTANNKRKRRRKKRDLCLSEMLTWRMVNAEIFVQKYLTNDFDYEHAPLWRLSF